MTARGVFIKLLLAVAGLIVVLALIVAAGYWLGGREATLQQLLQTAAKQSDGKLSIEGVSGSLYGAMRIARLAYEDADRRIVAEDIAIDWAPRLLLRRELLIRELDVRRLVLTSKQQSDEPPTAPESLRVAVDVRAPSIALGELLIEGGDSGTSIKGIRASLYSTSDRHDLQLANADTPWGRVAGRASLGTDKPYALAATVKMQGAEPLQFTIDAQASGPLAQLQVVATAVAAVAQLNATANIDVFSKMPIKHIAATVSDVNLRNLREDLPSSRLAAVLQGDIDSEGRLNGTVSVENALPGRIDAEKLPFKSLAAAVAGTMDAWQATALRLDLDRAGQFTGSASGGKSAAVLELSTANLNLHGIQTALRETKLAGKINLDLISAEKQHVVADLAQKPLRIRFDTTRDKNLLDVASAELASGKGRLAFSGNLRLDAERAFRMEGKLADFNPADFGKLPPARINAALSAQGELAPAPNGALRFTMQSSQWRGQPLTGKGTLRFAPQRVTAADIALAIGENRLTARGALGRAGDTLAWTIAAPRFQQIDPTLSGSLQGAGALRGAFAMPGIEFKLAGKGLVLPNDVRVSALTANGDVGTGANGAVNADIALQGGAGGGRQITTATLKINGTREQHALSATATAPEGIDAALEANGGWRAEHGWQGVLERFANKGRYAVRLEAPARVSIAPQRIETAALVLLAADGRVAIDQLVWSPEAIITRGNLRGLSLAYAQKLFPRELRAEEVSTTLVIGGDWNIRLADSVSGSFNLGRESGDVVLLTAPALPLDLTQMQLTAAAENNNISGRLDVAGSAIGTVGGVFTTRLSKRDGAWGIAGDAPLTASLTASSPSLAWLALFIGERMTLAGEAQLAFSRTGTLATGEYKGSVRADRLALRIAEYGVDLKDGQLRATFAGEKLILEQFTMRASSGTLTASGAFQLNDDTAEGGVQIRADKLALLDHPDYRLTVSGDGEVALKDRALAVTGSVRADEGQVTLPKSNAPELGNDVVVIGRTEAAKQQRATPVRIDVLLDLGDSFTLEGRGLDAELEGQLRVRSSAAGLPTGLGSIRVEKGTYEAYGQKLTIDRGILTFSGPINNPALDILAVRKNLAVEAGVALTGTALSPRVRLVSTPPVPDSEKLAWLTLGHGLEGASASDLDVLSAAATALASQGGGPSLTTRIARTVGLDDLSLSSGGGGLEQRALTLGKRISSSFYLSYELGIGGASRIARLQYELSKRWSVRAQAGTSSAVDLFFTLRFD